MITYSVLEFKAQVFLINSYLSHKVNIWIFCFPGKTEHFYRLRTKELCWEASAVSFKFFFIFLSISSSFSWLFSAAPQQLQKPRESSNVLNTNGASFDQVTRKFGPLYFKNVPSPLRILCKVTQKRLHVIVKKNGRFSLFTPSCQPPLVNYHLILLAKI